MTGLAPGTALRSRETFWRTLTTFTVTRALISLALLLYIFFNHKKTLDALHLIYWETCIGYFLMSMSFIGLAVFFRKRFLAQLTAQVIGDIAVIAILYIAAGGTKSGLAILFLFPLAGAAILAPLVPALFFVASVTLILLVESGYAMLESASDASISQAGLYGAAFFVAVYAINRLAARLINQEELATERGYALALQEAINRLVIADTGDGILVVTGDGTLVTANPAAERMLRFRIPDGPRYRRLSENTTLVPIADAFFAWVGRPPAVSGASANDQASIFVLIKPVDLAPDVTAQQALAGRRELTVHLKLRFAQVNAGLDNDERTVIFLQDVSEIDNRAQELKLASMGRLTASIAHEVRNPLSAISYSTSLLTEELADPGQLRLLSIVTDNVKRLNRMIEDILRLSRKAHRPEEAQALAPIIGTTVAEFVETHVVPAGLIHMTPIGADRVWFDTLHLQEVMINLLSNALRYASGAPGSIRIEIVPAAAGRLELHVQDDGPAITPAVRAHLFEPFYTTSSKGTGLGLYLARELCLNNGAVLDYEYRGDGPSATDSTNAAGVPSGRFVITLATAGA
ncbi:MAG: two-component sensor histidine kinase [Herminiimonas sp.]|nr:two-component sensor histidine kinase [Herminiimonas sp.]